MRRRHFLAASIALAALLPCAALAYSSPGISQGYVSDFASILSPATVASLDTELQQFDASTTIEIAVVTVPSLGGDDIASYGYQLGRDWGVGKKDTNNGLILLVAPTEHKVRIEVGYGLEGVVTDAISKEIIDGEITPAFKANDYDGGVTAGVHALEQVTSGSYEPVSVAGQSESESIPVLVMLVFFACTFVLFIIHVMLASAASSKHWWGGAITGILFGIFGGLISGSFFYGVPIVVGFFVFGGVVGLFGASQARKYEGLGKALPWYLSSSSGSSSSDGFSSSSGSSGGSSFGGGSFGGGGASGSW